MSTTFKIFFAIFLGFTSMKVNAQNAFPVNSKTEHKIDSLLKIMTLDEKIGQMNQYNGRVAATGPGKGREKDTLDVKNGLVGSMLNIIGAKNTRYYQNMALENSRLKIPLLFGYDVIHGFKTIFPVPLAEAASFDLGAIEKSARVSAIEASAAGIHWTFAPMVDIARDPRWGRVVEGAGEDTYYGSLVGAARIRGFQGTNLGDTNTVVACVKHFAAYGKAEGGRDYNTVDLSYREMNEIYLPPFKAAVDAGVGTLMNAFNEFDGMPATGNGYLVNEILKNKWGFNGMVVSDWQSILEMINHGVAKDKAEAALLAIKAGNDMDMESTAYRDELANLVKAGKVSEKLVDEAVRRVLRIKFQMELFDDPYRFCNPDREKRLELNPQHLETSRDVARKSMVLLKNYNQLLPLNSSTKTIAVIGPLADSKEDMIGSWSAQGDAKDVVTLLEGIKNAVKPGTKVLFEKGCNIDDDNTDNFKKAVDVALKADVVIMAVGESGNMTGEASSRAYLNIPGRQEELIKAVMNAGKPVVVVLFNGRPLVINWVAIHTSAIVEAWLPGTEAGNAIADVLFGKYNPSGKLPISFPYAVGQIPVYYNHKNTGRPVNKNNEKAKYLSKYIDIPNDPLFPFGYGLSYTSFKYSGLALNSNTMKMGGSINVTVKVTNTGKYDGEEVVQLYTRDLVGSVIRPVREMKGFKKVMLKTGETKEITFTITSDNLAFYTRDMSFKAEPGDFKVFVGTNSADCLEGAFTLIE